MKRFTFILLGLPALLALFFTSCGDTINEITEVRPVQMNTRTITYTVRTSDWSRASDQVGPYLFCEFREPLLTQNVMNNGMFAAYLSIDGRLSPLPFSDFWRDSSGTQWEEYLTCEFEPGWVTFIFKTDDQVLEPPFNYDFVVKLAW